MVSSIFNQTLANFYVRDPRTPTRRVNGFYNDNNLLPTIGGIPYNPRGYNPTAAAVGAVTYGLLAGYSNSYSPVLGRPINVATPYVGSYIAPSVNGYGSAAIVPGLRPTSSTNDTRPPAQTMITKQSYQTPATAANASSVNRLNSSNLPPGADIKNAFTLTPSATDWPLDNGQDDRVFITDPSNKLVAAGGKVMSPLTVTSGVLFPYTPTINITHKANYDSEQLIHTNYEMPVYKNSSVDQIGLQAKFTANTTEDAKYVLAVIHFFRAATKMFYGADSGAGTPPVVLRLDGYGQYMLNHLPVVCTSFDYSLPEDVDYIDTESSYRNRTGVGTKVPTLLQMNLTFKLVYSRNRLANTFSLEQFAAGGLLEKGQRGSGGPGGYL
jgi:hypothetical protein